MEGEFIEWMQKEQSKPKKFMIGAPVRVKTLGSYGITNKGSEGTIRELIRDKYAVVEFYKLTDTSWTTPTDFTVSLEDLELI